MRLCKLIKHDFEEGTVRNLYKFLIVVVVVVIQVYTFRRSLVNAYVDEFLFSQATVLDYFVYVMQGMTVFDFSPHDYFEIPIFWFSFQIGIAYIIAYYPEKDFSYFGKQIFLASKSRVRWWISKCIWCAGNVFLYFIIALCVCCMFSYLLDAEWSFTLSENILVTFFGSNIKYVDVEDMFFIAFLVPCVSTIALMLVQILFSFVLTPVISFAAVCAIYIVSAYYTNIILLGNNTMWLRSDYVNIDGINPVQGLILSGILIVGSLLMGCMYFEKCDIL